MVADSCNRFPLLSIEDAFRDQQEELGVLWSAAAGVAYQGAEDFASSPATYFAFDIWGDQPVLGPLKHHRHVVGASARDKDRV